MFKYKTRLIEKDIDDLVKGSKAAIHIVGPKWCGKTTTARKYCKYEINFQDEEKRPQYEFLSRTNVPELLNHPKPLLIDEWQYIVRIWNIIKIAVDKQEENNCYYFLTGSVTHKRSDNQDSGAGRFARIKMYPMSLYESGDSNGQVSLKSLLDDNVNISGQSNLSYNQLAYLILRGGWPELIGQNQNQIKIKIDTYLSEIFESNISVWNGVKKNPDLARKIAGSLARQICTIDRNSSYKNVYNGVINGKYLDVSYQTVLNYIEAFLNLFIIDEITSWASDKRNKNRFRLLPKKIFVDPSLAVRMLNLTDSDLVNDPNIFGLLFENLVARDLKVYMQSLGGSVESYRDVNRNKTCDFILNFPGNQFALVEVKLTINGFDQAIASLTKAYNQIKKKQGVKPKFMMIISNDTYASQIKIENECNLFFVPIGCLKN